MDARAFLSVASLQRHRGFASRVHVKGRKQNLDDKSPPRRFILSYLWNTCDAHFFTLGDGVSIDIKAKRYRAPRVVQGRYVADEP